MNIGFKKIITSLLTLSVTCSLFTGVSLTAKAATNVTVNLAAKKQVIRGFGGINVPAWAGDLTAAQRETAFGNGVNQLGFSVLRIFVDGNKNNWYKELPTAKSAIANGAIVFATPWNPPSDMIEIFTRNGVAGQKRLKRDKYAAYAQHLNEFVSYMKSNGVNLYSISVQNEPDYATEWTWWTPQEMLTFMKYNAGVINCKVMGPESFSYLKNMSDPILNDPQALANMDILGTHTYGTSVSNFAYPLFKQKGAGKELWMTEVYVPNSDAGSADRWPEALDVAKHMNDAMVEGDFQAYVWWYIRRQYGPMKEDGNISKRGFMMAHFSKFVRPGYVRVDATKSPATNVYTSAYTGNKKVVIIAINKGTSQVSQNFNVQNGATSSVSSWVTSKTLNMAKSNTKINTANGNFTASLPAQSVTTFVVDMTTTTVTPTPTPAPTTGTKIECENMTISGTYTKKITSPVSGVAFYGNNDYCKYTQYFANPTHSFSVKGCSSNSSTARVDLQIGGKTVGSFYFSGTTPTVKTLSNITHGTGNQEIKLITTTDNGTWDVYVDYLQVN